MPAKLAAKPSVANSTMRESGKVFSAVFMIVKLSDDSYLVASRNVTGFGAAEEAGYAKANVPWELEDKLIERGAVYIRVGSWQPHSIADGRLVTGQNPASAQGVAEKVIAIPETSETETAVQTV